MLFMHTVDWSGQSSLVRQPRIVVVVVAVVGVVVVVVVLVTHAPAVHVPPVQGVPSGWRPFGGQVSFDPSQVAATSQSPAADRHTVPAPAFASAGHAVLLPSQFSARSQAPTAARQVVPAFPAGCWQVTFVPSH